MVFNFVQDHVIKIRKITNEIVIVLKTLFIFLYEDDDFIFDC
jgi:hypothetical protein